MFSWPPITFRSVPWTTKKHYYIQTPPFPIGDLVSAGRMAWVDVIELADVVADMNGARPSRGDLTVFHESQGGIGDIALAGWAYDEARRRGLGQDLKL